MTRLALAVGGLLTLTGIVGYIATGAVSVTALIPSVVGVLMLACGAIAAKESMHHHGIHASLLIAVLGAIASLMNVAKLGELIAGTAERPSAIVLSLILFVVTLGYTAIGVRSFIMARRARTA